MRLARQVLTIAAKDLRAELRTKEAINASLAFALVILLMFSFAFDPEADTTREISGGLLWIVFAFAGTLILNRSFAREIPNDCLDALVSAPIPGAALFFGFMGAQFWKRAHVEAPKRMPGWSKAAILSLTGVVAVVCVGWFCYLNFILT